MTAAFLTILPIFALIALGWGAMRLHLIGERTGDGVSDYVFVIAIPLLLFKTLAVAKLPDAQPWPYWLSYFLGVALVWMAGTLIAERIFRRQPQESVVVGFSTGQSNTILIGIPLLSRVFGDEALVPLLLLVAVNTPLTISAATLMVEKADSNGGLGLVIVKKLSRNPIILGIIAGSIYRFIGLPIPETALATLKLIGDSAAPCALFAMGVALSRYGLGGEPILLALVVALKLIVHPLCVYLLATHVFNVPTIWASVGTLIAACPCGINAYLLAQRYKVGVGLSSGAIAISTVASIVTITFWVWLVQG